MISNLAVLSFIAMSNPIPNKDWRLKAASIDTSEVVLVRLYGENLSRPEWAGLNGSRVITSVRAIRALREAFLSSERARGSEPPENTSYSDYISFEFQGRHPLRFGVNRFSLREEHGPRMDAALTQYWSTKPISVPPQTLKKMVSDAKRLSKLVGEIERKKKSKKKAG